MMILGLAVALSFGARLLSLNRCERQIALRDYASAKWWMNVAQWSSPPTGHLRWLQARLDRKLGRLDQFAQSITLAQQAGVDPIKVQLEKLLATAQSGRMDEIEPRLGKLLVEHNEDSAEICEAFVLGCILNYRFAEAKKVLDAWQSDFPDDPQPHFLRGRILEHNNDYEGAETEFRTALRLQPRHAAAAFNLGRLLTVRQKPAEAREVYAACAKMLAYPNAAWVGIGRSERALGNTDEARRWLMKAAEGRDRPEVQEVYRWLGEPAESALAQPAQELGQLELNQEHFAEAVEWFEKAVAANPHDWKVRHGFATALQRHGESERAAKEFAVVEEYRNAWKRIDKSFDELQLAPRSAAVRTQIGAAFLKYYSENQGLIWLRSALGCDPNFAEAHRILADYFESHSASQPQFDELAKRHRAKAAAVRPDHGDATGTVP